MPPGRPSGKTLASLLLGVWLAACAAADAPPAPVAEATHCRADERVQFSCLRAKTVSLCAAGLTGSIDSLSYRYGTRGKVEKEFNARTDNSQRFQGSVMPAAPRALVRQVWFDQGDLRYLLTACVGGNCPQTAGLAVLQGEKVLLNRRCERPAPPSLEGFARELVRFGSSVDDSRSNTPLLELGEYDNLLEKLYSGGPRP